MGSGLFVVSLLVGEFSVWLVCEERVVCGSLVLVW